MRTLVVTYEVLSDYMRELDSIRKQLIGRVNSNFTPERLERNSGKVKVAGMLRGLRVSSGTPSGKGRAARMEFLALTISAGSPDLDALRMI
jgi:hypothetical protein